MWGNGVLARAAGPWDCHPQLAWYWARQNYAATLRAQRDVRDIEKYEQDQARCEALGDREGVSRALANLHDPYYRLGDYARARELREQAAAIGRTLRDSNGRKIQTVGALQTPPPSPASPRAFANGVAPAALFASAPRSKTDVSCEKEDHGAPDAYCASPDGTVQPGTALPDMPSPRSSTPPSDDLRRRIQLDERSEAPTHTSDDQDAWLDRSSDSECSEASECSDTGGPRASLRTQMDDLRREVRMRMDYPIDMIREFTRAHWDMLATIQAQSAETQHLREAVAELQQKYDLLLASQPNGWQITTAPAGAPEIASKLDLGLATGAAPSGTPTNNTTVPAQHVLEIASPLDLGRAGPTAPRQTLTQQKDPRDDPPAQGSSPTTGMAAGARDGAVNQLPDHVKKQTPNECPLAETADLGEIIPPLRETPDDDQDAWLDRSWGTAQAPAVSAPAQPASEPPPQKKDKKKKKRRTPRPTGGQAKEDLEASPLAYLAECAADEQALYEDSGGEESA